MDTKMEKNEGRGRTREHVGVVDESSGSDSGFVLEKRSEFFLLLQIIDSKILSNKNNNKKGES